jgi:Transglycosylase SLT domain
MRRAAFVLLILGLTAAGDATAQTDRPFERGGYAVLDHVAYAVDAVESAHGTDPRMWRPEPDGPQGPMQVSAAAATDVGGGDRFDEQQNRALGRAYLALMYRRYGSWPDALAAYNWGRGHVDSWIGEGRPFDKLPPSVERYRIRVLFGSPLVGQRLASVRAQPRRPAPDPYNGRAAVKLLYAEIMRVSDVALR